MNKKLRTVAPLISLLLAVSQATGQQADAPATGATETAPAPEANPAPNSQDSSAPPAAVAPGADTEVHDGFRALMDRPGGLTSDQAAKQAAEYSQDALIAQAQEKSARAQKSEVVYQYLPRVTLSASYTRQSVPDSQLDFGAGSLVGTPQPPGPLAPNDPLFAIDSSAFNFNPLPNIWYFNAGVVIPISDYLLNFSQALTGAEAATNAAKLNEQAARLNAAANARVSYYEWVRSRLQVAEAESSVKRASAQLDNLRRLQEGGRAARADVLRQDAFLSSNELGLRRASTREAVAREELHVLMSGGKSPAPEWEIGEDVLSDQPQDNTALEDIEALQAEAIETRLEIRSLDETKYALRQRKIVEQTRGYPKVEGFGNLTYANPNPRYVPPQNEFNGSWDVGVRMVWTLNDLGSNYSTARVTKSEMDKIEAEKTKIRDALRAEVLTAHRSIQEARLARDSARRGVEAAEAAYIDRSLLFDNGRATSLDVLQAETALITARLDLVDAYIALRQAEVRLDHAVGRDVPDELKSSQSATKN